MNRWIQQCRNAVLEYVISNSWISQVFSQEAVDEAALLRRDASASAKRVLWVIHLFWCKFVCQNIFCQFSKRLSVRVLCSSAARCSVLCSTAVPGNPCAPLAKVVLFGYASFVTRYDVPHFLCSTSAESS